MSRALWYLLVRQRKNALLRFARGLARPRRILAILFWCGIAALLVSARGGDAAAAADPARTNALMLAFLGFLLAGALLGGLLQRGPSFQPAEVDYLFAAPLSNRELLAYRVLSLYPLTILSSAFFLLLLAGALPHPGRAFVGVAGCQLVALHAQMAAAVVATTIGERVLRRLRAPLQALSLLLLCGLVAFAMVAVARGRASAEVADVFASPLARALLFPAAAAADLAVASEPAAAGSALLRLAAAWVASLAVLLLLPFDFREATFGNLERGARLFAGRDAKSGTRLRLGAPPALFSGANALAWRNLLALLRSPRSLLTAGVLTVVMTTLMLFTTRTLEADEAALAFRVLSVAAMLPVMLTQHLAFDFRRDFDHLGELKLLPARPLAVAVAQVAVPTLVALLLQVAILAVASSVVELPPWTAPAALLVFPPLTLAVCLLHNLGFLLHPMRGVSAGNRPSMGGAAASTLFGLLGLLVAVTPAVVTFVLVLEREEDLLAPLVAAVACQYVIDLGLLLLVARAFARLDVARAEA